MAEVVPYRVKTISEFHTTRGLPKPEHPLVSVVDFEQIKHLPADGVTSWVFDFYAISLKRNVAGKIRYGQQEYDFDEGIMFFISPGQVFGIGTPGESAKQQSGYLLLVHPDFFWGTPLAKTIKQYEYFDYSVNEALFLSDKEELIIKGILHNIEQEYRSSIDRFSQNIIIAQLEVLFNYSERFYQRQFITRKIVNHQTLGRLETVLEDYFSDPSLIKKGLPTVKYVSTSLNISPNYLSGLLKVLTGKSTKQHIQDKVIEYAKQQLSTTGLSVSEIAYGLGFEYPQSFSKLFKTKTSLSPLEFRQTFHAQ